MLRAPVVQQCQQVPLQGCDELSEGVLLYLSGEKAEGRTKLLQGAAKNSPEEVRKYAVALRALETAVPGVQKYTQPLGEITTILIQASAVSQVAQPSKGNESPGALAANPYAPEKTPASLTHDHRLLTADTDVTRMRYGTLGPPSESHPWCSQAFGQAQCVLVQRGTLVLTDLVSVGSHCEGQFMAIMRGGLVQLRFDGAFDLHGARIVIPQTDALVLGQLSGSDASTPSDSKSKAGKAPDARKDSAPSRTCGFYYSGYMPYEGPSESASGKDLE